MAINKNFVVKNGLEVNTNLIVAEGQTVGIATSNPSTAYNLHVFGGIGVTDAYIAGVSTFASNLDINASVDISNNLVVDGWTDVDDLNVSGVSTFASNLDINASVDINSNLVVDGWTDVDDLNVSGVSTFASNLDINASVDINSNLVVSGVSTFVGVVTNQSTIFANQLSVAGISTFNEDVHFSGSAGIVSAYWDKSANALKFNDGISANFGQGNDLKIYHDGSENYIDDAGVGSLSIRTLGNNSINLQNSTNTMLSAVGSSGSVELYYGGNKKLETISVGATVTGTTFTNQLSVSGVSTFVGVVTNQSTIFANQLSVAGISTFTSNLDINASIDVDGHTELDDLNVSGVSTFASNLDINASIDVDGHTELDDLNVSGVSTFASNLDINASVDISNNLVVDGWTDVDDLNVSGVSTFASNLDINASIDVDGHTELDDLNVSGVSTFASNLDINASVDINSNLVVDGWTDVDDLNVVGVVTVTGSVKVDNVRIDGNTVDTTSGNLILDSTGGVVDVNDDVDISGNVDIEDVTQSTSTATGALKVAGGVGIVKNLNVGGIATFASDVTIGTGLTATIYGPANFIIDPATAGDNTGSVRIKGDLYVDGTNFIVNSETITLADFIVGIASTATSDALADGAGIQIGPNNTFLYDNSNTAFKSSENLNLASGKTYKINGTDILSSTTLGSSVVNSSLTSVGTLTGLTVSGDVSIADKIVHTGDTNTYIRFLSADTFTITTNGIERVRVDSSGNVGVGTTGGNSADSNNTTKLNAGIVTANYFYGDGSGLSNVAVGAGGINKQVQYNNSGTSSGAVNLIYDASTDRVGIGSTIPTSILDVKGVTTLENANVSGMTTLTNLNVNGPTVSFGSTVLPATDDYYDLGSGSYRWKNIYTTDLQLSNEGSSNDVDGTWGKWTIQEGENDLFIINRRTGKKYKFLLSEV